METMIKENQNTALKIDQICIVNLAVWKRPQPVSSKYHVVKYTEVVIQGCSVKKVFLEML